MARYAPVALVAALLVATGAAFAYTEKLKLTPSPILGTRVDKVFSPICDCARSSARVAFRLRRGDAISVDVVDGGGNAVRTLVREQPAERGQVEVFWDGRDDAGAVVSEGAYRPRVRLARERRTIVLPNPIRVDVTPPVVERFSVTPRVFSPDGDGRRDTVVARYRISEPAQVSLFVEGRRQVLKRGRRQEGEVRWFGIVDGETVAPGRYRLVLGATDLAGNPAQRSAPALVVARTIALGRKQIDAVAGRSFAVLVVSDARRIAWKLGGRTGEARPGSLRLSAPRVPGRYTLTVTANGVAARAAVLVGESPESP